MSLNSRSGLGISVNAQSFRFFGSHKWLILLPITGYALVLISIALVAFGVFEVVVLTDYFGAGSISALQSEADEAFTDKVDLLSVAGIASVFCLYFAVYVILNIFNVALAACTLSIFRGEKIGFLGGLSVSINRLSAIFGWSAAMALVGTISAILESERRDGMRLASILTFLAQLTWRMATFFVIPIIASKKIGTISAIKESVQLMQQVWGASVRSRMGFAGIKILALLAIMGLTILFQQFAAPQFVLDAMAVLTPLVLIGILALSAIATISRTALFFYATENVAPPQFDGETLKNAIVQKVSMTRSMTR